MASEFHYLSNQELSDAEDALLESCKEFEGTKHYHGLESLLIRVSSELTARLFLALDEE